LSRSETRGSSHFHAILIDWIVVYCLDFHAILIDWIVVYCSHFYCILIDWIVVYCLDFHAILIDWIVVYCLDFHYFFYNLFLGLEETTQLFNNLFISGELGKLYGL